MTRLFEMVAKPLARIQTPGTFVGGLRLGCRRNSF
jgi:hypothetical protein